MKYKKIKTPFFDTVYNVDTVALTQEKHNLTPLQVEKYLGQVKRRVVLKKHKDVHASLKKINKNKISFAITNKSGSKLFASNLITREKGADKVLGGRWNIKSKFTKNLIR